MTLFWRASTWIYKDLCWGLCKPVCIPQLTTGIRHWPNFTCHDQFDKSQCVILYSFLHKPTPTVDIMEMGQLVCLEGYFCQWYHEASHPLSSPIRTKHYQIHNNMKRRGGELTDLHANNIHVHWFSLKLTTRTSGWLSAFKDWRLQILSTLWV